VKRNLSRISRRRFAQGVAGLAATFGLATHVVQAAPDDSALFGGQAEWVQQYDVDPSEAIRRSTTPLLSAQTIDATQQAIDKYQQLVDHGGWPTVQADKTLRLGTTGPIVTTLRKRLIASGDIVDRGEADSGSKVFDSFVEAGVKRFQVRHGLSPTGIVTADTIEALNVPADVRLRQLQINLIRLKAFSGDLGERYVSLNIPAAEVETVENGQVVTHHIAGVGRIDRQSPVMQTRAIDINFNPYWTVPASIIRKDLIPKMQANAQYLTQNHIRVFDKQGQEVPPGSINWNSMDAVNYRFRQDPGADFNSLGVVRVNIANPYGVYMHDTPEKGIFGDDSRFVSSGCVRVEDIRDYVTWLLKDNPGWDRTHVDDAIASGQQINVKLEKPVNVYWVYVTAWASDDGVVEFRSDIYKRDGFGAGNVADVSNSSSGGEDAGASGPLQTVNFESGH
jgi:L,D-transpeptidase YcbB